METLPANKPLDWIAPHMSPRLSHRRAVSDPVKCLDFLEGFTSQPRGGDVTSDTAKRIRRQSMGVEMEEGHGDSPKRVRATSPIARVVPAAAEELAPAPAPAPPPPPPTAEVECAICCSQMEDPAVGGGCAHHFCHGCLESWVKTKPSCPTCRAPVWSISRDAEFATLIGANPTERPSSGSNASNEAAAAAAEGGKSRASEAVRTNIFIHAPAGVTIASNGNGDCVVTRVVRGNGFDQAGVHVGDIVLAVNGTEVRDHSQCIEFIERRCRVNDCEITYRPVPTSLLVRTATSLLSQIPEIVTRVRRRSSLVPRPTSPRSSAIWGPSLEVSAAAPFESQ